MNKPLALEMESLSLHRGPVGGTWWGGGSFTGDFERKVRFCSIRGPCFFFRGSERCIKKGSGNGNLSPYWPHRRLEGRFVYRGLQETVNEGSGNGASVLMGALQGEPGGSASLLGTPKDI